MTIPSFLIESDTISSAWCHVIETISKHGEHHVSDYGVPTKRIHLTLKIKDVHTRQASEQLPFGTMSLDKYKAELTEEYSNWYTSLAPDDPRRFVYCYAKQLFQYGSSEYNTLRENIKNLRAGSRRHVGVLWENELHIPTHEDQPCWIAYKLEVMDAKHVRLFILYRSWDAFGGLPANLPAIVYGVEKVLSEEGTGYTIGELLATGWDAHIYEPDMQAVENIIRSSDWCYRCDELKPRSKMVMRDRGCICSECLGGRS